MAPVVIALIRGYNLVRGRAAFLSLVEGQGVILDREPQNIVDPRAVLVVRADDKAVGYVDRISAGILASHMDAGVVYTAHVLSKPRVTHFGRIVKDSCRIKCIPIFGVKKDETRDLQVPVLWPS